MVSTSLKFPDKRTIKVPYFGTAESISSCLLLQCGPTRRAGGCVAQRTRACAQVLRPLWWHSLVLYWMLHETSRPSARLAADGNSAELQASFPALLRVHLNHWLLLAPHLVALRCPFRHVRRVHRPVKHMPAQFPLLRNGSGFVFEHFPARLKHLCPSEGVVYLPLGSFLHQLTAVLFTVPPFRSIPQEHFDCSITGRF